MRKPQRSFWFPWTPSLKPIWILPAKSKLKGNSAKVARMARQMRLPQLENF